MSKHSKIDIESLTCANDIADFLNYFKNRNGEAAAQVAKEELIESIAENHKPFRDAYKVGCIELLHGSSAVRRVNKI